MKNFEDIRWIQRFSNYNKALLKLSEAIHYIQKSDKNTGQPFQTTLNDIIKQGLIQSFEYTHELAWNVMKDYAFYQGNASLGGSRDATREALQLQLITDGNVWMDMIASRNKTSHTYNEFTANEIFKRIIEDYYPAFVAFQKNMEVLKNKI